MIERSVGQAIAGSIAGRPVGCELHWNAGLYSVIAARSSVSTRGQASMAEARRHRSST